MKQSPLRVCYNLETNFYPQEGMKDGSVEGKNGHKKMTDLSDIKEYLRSALSYPSTIYNSVVYSTC